MPLNVSGTGGSLVEVGTRDVPYRRASGSYHETIYGTVSHSGIKDRAEAERIAHDDADKFGHHTAIHQHDGTYDVLEINVLACNKLASTGRKFIEAAEHGDVNEALKIDHQITVALRAAKANPGFTFID